MGSPLVRQANAATNPLHSLVYFAPETGRAMTRAPVSAGAFPRTGAFARPR